MPPGRKSPATTANGVRLRSPSSIVAAAILASACSRPGYSIAIRIIGDASSFTGRSIQVEGQTAPQPTPEPDGKAGTQVYLCTENKDAFLNRSVRVVVREGQTVLSDGSVARFACRLDPAHGQFETDVILLEPAGSIAADFENDRRTATVCAAGGNADCHGHTDF